MERRDRLILKKGPKARIIGKAFAAGGFPRSVTKSFRSVRFARRPLTLPSMANWAPRKEIATRQTHFAEKAATVRPDPGSGDVST